jgi:LEA14-like dessication related protein
VLCSKEDSVVRCFGFYSLLLIALVGSACGQPPQRPTLTATGLKLHKPGVSGLPVDVTFRLQNPNPDPMTVERFDYEIVVNTQTVGRGFVAEPALLEPFKETDVRSRFNINYFSIPGAVKQILGQDRMDAMIRGTFYVKGRLRTQQLPFEAASTIPIGKADQDGAPPPGGR